MTGEGQDSIRIRPMQSDDVEALLPLHQAVFEGTLGAALGTRYLTAFLHWFIEYPPALSLVAEVDEQLAGYVFGAPVGYGTQLNRNLFGTIVLGIATNPQVMFYSTFMSKIKPRLLSVLGARSSTSQFDDLPIGPQFSLVGIGVSQALRRQGIARSLIVTFAQQVWQQPFDEIRLTVYRKNIGARQFYDAAGWTVKVDDGHVITYALRRPQPGKHDLR